MKRVLVTGGCGYIGSHMALALAEAGTKVVVLDNLHSGHAWALPPTVAFELGDIADRELVTRLITEHRIDTVFHFAGYVVVSESVANPSIYYQNNVVGSLNLIETCLACGIEQFVFSSSAAVYGIPLVNRVSEDAPTNPVNPYGNSKLMTEQMLYDLAATHPKFRFAALRYFNVAGARSDGTLGQATPQATHLIKVACEAACGTRDGMSIFGDDYPTPDGTCVRDYIHVEDLVSAHLAVQDYLAQGGENITLNCGYGRGYSVKEVIECVKAVSKVDFPVKVEARRAGDSPELIADNTCIRRRLKWQPRHQDLSHICSTAYRWEKSLSCRQFD